MATTINNSREGKIAMERVEGTLSICPRCGCEHLFYWHNGSGNWDCHWCDLASCDPRVIHPMQSPSKTFGMIKNLRYKKL